MDEGSFAEMFEAVEPRLRRALVAWYGPIVGKEAAAEALSWAWEHRHRLDGVGNIGGYLFRVGQSAAKRDMQWRRPIESPSAPSARSGNRRSSRGSTRRWRT